ncbi:hypothetical protein D3C86_1700610 [compost metagenome]
MNVGFKGLNIDSGEGVILATGTTAFIEACDQLLKDRSYREKVGTAGKSVIDTQFDWDVVSKKLEDYFTQISRKN